MGNENIPQQPLPREGGHYDTTPLELSHVDAGLHDTWLRAVSIVWNDAINSKPWGKNRNDEWVQILNEEQDIQPLHHSFEDFLVSEPVVALTQLGFNDPDGGAKEKHPKSLPAVKVVRFSELGKEVPNDGYELSDGELTENVEYKFKAGTNGWFSQSATASIMLQPQLTLVIPPKPANEADQGMALVDYKLAGLSYPFTICA